MQKVYLLLRNNQQTGPHSLEELLQLDLKPFDLIWVEGKSYGWSYPSEIETLKPFVRETNSRKIETVAASQQTLPPTVNKPAPQKIFVSLPVANVQNAVPSSSSFIPDPIEQKAEELRKRIQSYSPQKPIEQEEIKTNYTRSLNEVEENYTSWIYQKKTKKKKPINYKYWMATGIMGLAVAGAWLMAKSIYKEPAAPLQQSIMHKEQKAESSAEIKVLPVIVTEKKSSKQSPTPNPTKKPKKKIEPVARTGKAAPIDASSEEAAQKNAVALPIENPPSVTEEKKEPVVAEAPKEKKKSLKQILGALFKKNKKDDAVQEEPRPADNSNDERKSTRRDELSNELTSVDLTDQVDIKMNKSSDDWMMGIQGLKLTLYNRSSANLKSADVEVLYYSEQNNLLDKKTVHFTSIASKKSQTLAAPDHRMADHVEYKIISAMGEEKAYAKQ